MRSQSTAHFSNCIVLDALLDPVEGNGGEGLVRDAISLMRLDSGERNYLCGSGVSCRIFRRKSCFLGTLVFPESENACLHNEALEKEVYELLESQKLTEPPDRKLLFGRFDGMQLCALYVMDSCCTGKTQWFFSNLKEFAQPLHLTQCSDGVGVLFSVSDYKGFCARAGELAKNNNILCGASARYDNRELAAGCFEKARRAAAECTPENPFLNFADVRWDCFRADAGEALLRAGVETWDFIHGTVKRINSYDRENRTEYFRSVFLYLLHGKNLREAAAQLNVHRNTLDYRINRAKELFNIDFTDSGICFELLFSFMLYEENFRDVEETAEISGEERTLCLWAATKREAITPPATRQKYKLLYCPCDTLGDETRAKLIEEAAIRFPCAETAFDERRILVLFDSGADSDEKLAGDIETFLNCYHCKGVLSGDFSLDRMPAQLAICEMCCAMGPRFSGETPLYRVEEINSFLMLAVIERNKSLSMYYCDEVMHVLQHDYERGSQLANSLFIYLSSFLDLKKAAAETSLHRNTVDYHVKKIQKILSIAHPDRKLLFEMLCTYRMLAVSDAKQL